MPDTRTAAERSLAASIAANHRWATSDPHAGTASARQAFAEKWEREVDPDGILEPAERARRAECARRAHFQRLALKSAKARRAAATRAADDAA